MKRIVLIVPNFRWIESDENWLWNYIPYNLCLLAAAIRDIADVCILDAYKANMGVMDFVTELQNLNPDIVGITVLMDKYGETGHTVARIAKNINWRTKVVMGGVYATVNADEVIKDQNIDHVIAGEGEKVLRDIVKGDLKEGIHRPPPIENLDSLPFPAYDLINLNEYINKIDRKSVDAPQHLPFARIITSRGCPCGCSFCQVETISGKKFRGRSAGNVLEEIAYLKDTYNIRSVIFDDDNMLLDKQRAIDIFQGMIGMDITWSSIATAVFELDRDMIRLMKKSGCSSLGIAIESGCERILKSIIRKPINLKYAEQMIGHLRDEGIYTSANFIIGFPTETWDEIRQTLKYAEDINVDYIKIFTLMPLKQTELANATTEFAKEVSILRAYEWDRINFTDSKKLKRTAEKMGITEEELNAIRRKTIEDITV